MTDDKRQPTKEELEDALKFYGRKIGLLLSKTNFPPEVKEDLIELIAQASFDKIEEFLNVLEADLSKQTVSN